MYAISTNSAGQIWIISQVIYCTICKWHMEYWLEYSDITWKDQTISIPVSQNDENKDNKLRKKEALQTKWLISFNMLNMLDVVMRDALK